MMTKYQKIAQLRQNIVSSLDGLIDRDYVLLDLPYYMNVGDILIWEGERQYLKTLEYKYLNAGYCYRKEKIIQDDTLILLQGGGNFGDLYRIIQDERLRIIQRYKANPIVIFPVTCWYEREDVMRKDAEIMATHPNLTICTRDVSSYDIVCKNFKNKCILMPDMAFFMNERSLRKKEKKSSTLYVRRIDNELAAGNNDLEILKREDVVVSDWPSWEKEPRHWHFYKKLKRLGHDWENNAWKMRFFWRTSDVVTGLSDLYYHQVGRKMLIRQGASFIGQYDDIYTTRLHGAILAILMNRPVHLFDNSYGKNASFYNTWLHDVDGVELIANEIN